MKRFKYKTIKIWEKAGILGKISLTPTYLKWLRDENHLLQRLIELQEEGKLPPWRNEINKVMAKSHHNCSVIFEQCSKVFGPKPNEAKIVDIDYILEELK